MIILSKRVSKGAEQKKDPKIQNYNQTAHYKMFSCLEKCNNLASEHNTISMIFGLCTRVAYLVTAAMCAQTA